MDNRFNNQRVNSIIANMSVEDKLLCVHGQLWDPYRANQAGFVRGNEKYGIPDFFIADGESGVNISWETTSFPSKVSLASTFDRDCAFAYGNAMGQEAKSAGIHLLLTPRVNIVRDPLAVKGTSNGGNYQTYGEDPVLNGEMGAKESQGIQNNKQALANLKQMFGSSTGSAQGAGNCVMDGQTINELYMRPYELVIKAGVASGMTNYNQINGTWTYDYGYMMTECARDKWGFKGFLFDDWYCLYDPNAIRHGVTLEMPGEDYYNEGSELSCYGKKLLKAIEDPDQPVTMEDLDHAVYYYLDTLDRFGMLDEKQRIPGPIEERIKMESAKTARMLAGKGAVLLKNEDHILPINFENKKIAIIGPGGGKQVMPTFKESPYGFADRKNSVYNILKAKFKDNISFAVGDDLDGEVIGTEYLTAELGTDTHGLQRYVERFTYETLCDGTLEDYPRAAEYVVDQEINYKDTTALPPLKREQRRGFFKETPKEYYMWHGYLTPKETGMFRISLQSKFPDREAFEKNHVENGDLSISTSGNLYLREVGKVGNFNRIGMGTRVSANGIADPFSEVVSCRDGWNNAGGTLYMEAGKTYEIYFNHTCIYLEPLEVRLAWTTPSMQEKALRDAVALAKKSDIAICFAWHQSVNDSLSLEENQDELIEKVAEANTNTVVVLNNGDPLLMPWRDKVKGILEMWFSGQEGALATMDVLEGKVNPAGRLPVTFPQKLSDLAARDEKHGERYAATGRISEKDAVHPNTAHFTEGLLNGYRWFDEMEIEPLYPFGYGLSYTKFDYRNIGIEWEGEQLKVIFEISNTGTCDGEEVVQCYLGKPQNVPHGIQAVPKMLVDFARVSLGVHETKRIELTIDELYLKYFDDKEGSYKLFTGERDVYIGASSRDIRLKSTIDVTDMEAEKEL
ncbi:MAG: glycoside hydrolase family 3 C-terminal domain-containing protein [Lachnospiraceae bacterium]|nr:glycoside hydrolase family 3 C-terminal domain-containing protein [Lachnospiraceae bacterium]